MASGLLSRLAFGKDAEFHRNHMRVRRIVCCGTESETNTTQCLHPSVRTTANVTSQGRTRPTRTGQGPWRCWPESTQVARPWSSSSRMTRPGIVRSAAKDATVPDNKIPDATNTNGQPSRLIQALPNAARCSTVRIAARTIDGRGSIRSVKPCGKSECRLCRQIRTNWTGLHGLACFERHWVRNPDRTPDPG